MESSESKSFADLLNEVITSPKKFFLFLALILATSIMIVGALCIVVNIFSKKATSIEVKASGALVIQLDNNLRTASYLLSANGNDDRSPWVDTNIDLKEGDKITFHVSGKVCMAMHRMMDAADSNTIMPPLPWCGPEGFDLNSVANSRPAEVKRKNYLICPEFNQGQVLGIITNKENGILRPDSLNVIDVNKYTDEYYEVKRNNGHLWLLVNEVFLDDKLLNSIEPEDLAIDSTEFNFIKKNHYSNVWYDDNCGFFSINMEICR
jgi:hypothetical protein